MQLTDNQNLQTMKTAEEKAMEFLATHGYTNGLVDHKGNDGKNYSIRLSKVLVEYANQQPEQGEVEQIANILEWYDDLSPTDKCTVHGMVGTGLYAKTKKQLAEDYLRKHTVKSTLTQDNVMEAAEKVCCDNQEMTDQRVEVSLNDKDGTYIDVNVDFCKNCGTCKDVWQYG